MRCVWIYREHLNLTTKTSKKAEPLKKQSLGRFLLWNEYSWHSKEGRRISISLFFASVRWQKLFQSFDQRIFSSFHLHLLTTKNRKWKNLDLQIPKRKKEEKVFLSISRLRRKCQGKKRVKNRNENEKCHSKKKKERQHFDLEKRNDNNATWTLLVSERDWSPPNKELDTT